MRISIFVGDLTEAPADAVCTSTNPRLSLMMGTGGAVRERGGTEVLRACEQIIQAEFERRGERFLRPGTAHITTAGRLPFKGVIHCVASDTSHLTSENVIRACVRNALTCAEAIGCSSVAMPVFGTGHAHMRFDRALRSMMDALQIEQTRIEHVIIVILDADHEPVARRLVGAA